MKNKNDRAASRPSINSDEDSRAGAEGLEEDLSAARSRQSNERMEGSPSRSRSSNVRSDDVRDPSSINRTTERHRSSESSQKFEGQGVELFRLLHRDEMPSPGKYSFPRSRDFRGELLHDLVNV